MKKWSKKDEEEFRESPFQLVSQGLGLRFAYDNRDQLQDNLGYSLNGKFVGLPRYWVQKLQIDTDIMREYSKSANAEKVSQIARRLGFDERKAMFLYDMYDYTCYNGKPLFNDVFSSYIRASQKQREINYKSRERFKKGNF